MRELREPDAFPAGDIGLLRALADAGGKRPTSRELLARALTRATPSAPTRPNTFGQPAHRQGKSDPDNVCRAGGWSVTMTTPSRYDVVIVGARCAGATLATFLARAGASVLLLDKDPLSRDQILSTHTIHPPVSTCSTRWVSATPSAR